MGHLIRSLHSVLLSVHLSVCLPAADVSGVRGVQQVLDLFPTERGEEGTADSLKVTGVDHPCACADYVQSAAPYLSCGHTTVFVQMVLDAFSARCDDAQFTEALRSPLTHLCVRYLTTRRGGRVIDPVGESHDHHMI